MSEMNADLKAAQQRILALKHNLLELEEAGKRTAERLIHVERRLSDANGEVLRLGLQLKHHLQLQAERDALVAKLAELEKQEPIGEVTHSDVLPNAEEKYRHEFVSDFRIGVQAELYARPIPAEPVNARLLDALKLAECVYRKNVVNEGEPSSVLEAMQAAITAAEAQRPTDYSSTVDRAWARFCGAFGDGPDAPYPGMIASFEIHYGQSFRDKEWRTEASCWAAAWSKATARAEAALAEPQPDALEQARGEEREAHIAIVKEAFEGATISKYATSLEVLAARGMAAHLLDAIRARGQK